jgi:hypothetical protein
VKVALTEPESPSSTVTSLTERDGSPSSSMIVPAPRSSAITALGAFDRMSR